MYNFSIISGEDTSKKVHFVYHTRANLKNKLNVEINIFYFILLYWSRMTIFRKRTLGHLLLRPTK